MTTSSPEETRTWGREFARQLSGGDCLALIGDLGSGKTCLTQGICEGFHVKDRVNSPTFILVNEYSGEYADGRPVKIFHFDLYRLGGAEELADLGWDDYLAAGGICLVEWADRALELLPEHAIEIRIDAPEQEIRAFTIHRGEKAS
jgi:tRNA threonylcarbamoyladenosine biosynthesis protein TsaE